MSVPPHNVNGWSKVLYRVEVAVSGTLALSQIGSSSRALSTAPEGTSGDGMGQ
jgi:hypothetical protein